MIESTLKEYVDKVGTQITGLPKFLGYLCSCLLNHCKINAYILFLKTMKKLKCYSLQKKSVNGVKMTLLDLTKLFLAWLLVLFFCIAMYIANN